MLSLAIDTALQRCSVALFSGTQLIAHRQEELVRGHAERLAPLVKAVLDDANHQKVASAERFRLPDLDRVGVIVGPGGFTGIRVGLAFARGLALGNDIEVIGINSLEALAVTALWNLRDRQSPLPSEGTLVACIDARRGEVYAAFYHYDAKTMTQIRAPFAASPNQAMDWARKVSVNSDVIYVGSGVTLLNDIEEQSEPAILDTQQIDISALGELIAGLQKPARPPSPLYLRAPDAKPSAASLFAHLTNTQNGEIEMPEGGGRPAFIIRDGGPDDGPELVRLEAEAFGDRRWPLNAIANSLIQPFVNVHFILDSTTKDGQPRLIGYIVWRQIADEGEILSLGIQRDRQRNGLATHLINHMHHIASDKALLRIILEVDHTNAAALALYRRAGYQMIGSRKHYYADGTDAVVMAKALR